MWWLCIGLGVWLGLVFPQYTRLLNGKYSTWALLKGLVLTVLLWPIALFTNRDLS